jgi:hypothetical protein
MDKIDIYQYNNLKVGIKLPPKPKPKPVDKTDTTPLDTYKYKDGLTVKILLNGFVDIINPNPQNPQLGWTIENCQTENKIIPGQKQPDIKLKKGAKDGNIKFADKVLCKITFNNGNVFAGYINEFNITKTDYPVLTYFEGILKKGDKIITKWIDGKRQNV